MWSYSGDPSLNHKDAVRFYVGDTDPSDPLLQDGEINYLLRQYNYAIINTAIRACETIMSKFARMANESVGSVSIQFNQKYKAYMDIRATLTQRLALETITPYAGGISKTDIQQNNQNADRVKPDFTKHMMENDVIAPWVTSEWGLWGEGPGGFAE